MPQIIVPVAVGSLIALQHFPGPHRLGLVVNQKAGERWVERDPFPPTKPKGVPGLLLVRLLGECTSDMHYFVSDEAWKGEPRRTMTVRWAYVQTRPNLPWVVAGPDTFGIEKFFEVCRTCEALGMAGAIFMNELGILLGHLKQNKLVTDETGVFERRYRAMLADVLPLS